MSTPRSLIRRSWPGNGARVQARASEFPEPGAAGAGAPGGTDDAGGEPDWVGCADEPARMPYRSRLILLALIAFAVFTPTIERATHPGRTPHAELAFLLAGTAVFAIICYAQVVFNTYPAGRHVPWPGLIAAVALANAIFVVGGANWLATPAVAAALCGRFSRTPRPAYFGATVGALAGLILSVRDDFGFGSTLSVIVVPIMAAYFAYEAGRRIGTLEQLRQTRAELARMAVSEERLRIARDLHDLLGHSLSLITLKAELAGRMINADTARAGQEVADLEVVARQALTDVREAVAGYRQPDLRAELGSARQLLTAAGVACDIAAPDSFAFRPEVDAVLAWTVREGATNVVRHARAARAAITLTIGPAAAVIDISDNGLGARSAVDHADDPMTARAPGPALAEAAQPSAPGGATASQDRSRLVPRSGATEPQARPRLAGSGLAGLAERVRRLGGSVSAGAIQPHGFRLHVTVPTGA
jgi:two-component system sensor histidine kinase DesK